MKFARTLEQLHSLMKSHARKQLKKYANSGQKHTTKAVAVVAVIRKDATCTTLETECISTPMKRVPEVTMRSQYAKNQMVNKGYTILLMYFNKISLECIINILIN